MRVLLQLQLQVCGQLMTMVNALGINNDEGWDGGVAIWSHGSLFDALGILWRFMWLDIWAYGLQIESL